MKNIQEIRKAVATLANSINKKIKNLSAAFKKAWAEIKGINKITLQSRLDKGYSIKRALEEPINKKCRNNKAQT